jgi:hypothetical protein
MSGEEEGWALTRRREGERDRERDGVDVRWLDTRFNIM